MPTDRAKTREG